MHTIYDTNNLENFAVTTPPEFKYFLVFGNFMKTFAFILISVQKSLAIETSVNFPTANVFVIVQ